RLAHYPAIKSLHRHQIPRRSASSIPPSAMRRRSPDGERRGSVYDPVDLSGIRSIHRRKRRSLVSVAVLALLIDRRGGLAGVNRWTSRGPEGASILSLAIDPTRPDI